MFGMESINQVGANIKFDWGRSAFDFHQERTDVFIAVDVFSFSFFLEHCESEGVKPFTPLYRGISSSKPVLMGCMRNAKSVAKKALEIGKNVTVIALGDEIGMLGFRPNFEDLMGAGAIIAELQGKKSSQAESAQDSFEYNKPKMAEMLAKCAGGKLILSHSSDDSLKEAAKFNCSEQSPRLHA